MTDKLELRRKISAVIWGCDTRDASFIAEKIMLLLVQEGIIND